MNTTDELRRMLDERGVEWTSGDTEVSRNKYTHFCPDAGMSMGVWESEDGKLGIDAHTDYRFTPAQAIAATLGTGTCRLEPWEVEPDTGTYYDMRCGCGYVADVADWAEWRFCPNCGRKVVDE